MKEKAWRRGQKRDYTDRPLTEEEKIFAGDDENYHLLFFYMKKWGLDEEEWYDILIIPYLQAVKKYHEYEPAKKYTFSTVLKKKLETAISNELRSRKTMKRMPEGGFVSLDSTIEGDNPFSEHKIEAYWFDKSKNVETYVIEKEFLRDIFANVNRYAEPDLMKIIIEMRIEGYSDWEIARKARYEIDEYENWTIAEIKELIRILTLGRNKRCPLSMLIKDTQRYGNLDKYDEWENLRDFIDM